MSKEEKQVKESNIEGSLNRLSRRVDTMQKSLDLLFEDRKILEEILGSLAMLKELQFSTRSHQENLTKDIKAEVVDTKMEVKDKVNEIVGSLDKKKIIRIPDKGFLRRFMFWRG